MFQLMFLHVQDIRVERIVTASVSCRGENGDLWSATQGKVGVKWSDFQGFKILGNCPGCGGTTLEYGVGWEWPVSGRKGDKF